LRDELPRTGDAREPVTARGGFVLARELFERGGQLALPGFGERFGGGVGVLGIGGAARLREVLSRSKVFARRTAGIRE
jgi:hypothetical protein